MSRTRKCEKVRGVSEALGTKSRYGGVALTTVRDGGMEKGRVCTCVSDASWLRGVAKTGGEVGNETGGVERIEERSKGHMLRMRGQAGAEKPSEGREGQ